MIEQAIELIKSILLSREVQSMIVAVLGILFFIVVMDEITK